MLLYCFYYEQLSSHNISISALAAVTNSMCQKCKLLLPYILSYIFYLQIEEKLLQLPVSRLSSVSSFSSYQMTRHGRNYKATLEDYTFSFSECGGMQPFFQASLCHLPTLSLRLIPACSQIRGNWQQQIRPHKSLGSGWSTAAGKERVHGGCVNQRSPRCSSLLTWGPWWSPVPPLPYGNMLGSSTLAMRIGDFWIMAERSKPWVLRTKSWLDPHHLSKIRPLLLTCFKTNFDTELCMFVSNSKLWRSAQ